MKDQNNVDTTNQPASELTHISLCAGYGGIDLGLHRVFGQKLRTIAFSEIETFAVENLLAKMEAGLLPAAPVWTDLRTFPWADFQGVDILSGGFPCQPFSAAGKRNADSDPRHLFPAIIEGIRHAKPRLVFLENVEGIVSSKLAGDGWRDPAGTPVLLHVLRELERVGYRATAGIFSASEVGAPHQRKRVFILAYRSDSGLQGREWFWQTRTQGESSGYASECGGSMADSILRGMSGSRNELGNIGEAGQGRENLEKNSYIAWPSRPGEPQHGWEPPRVVGAVPAKLADFCTRDSQQGGDTSPTSGESVGAWRKSEDAMPHSGSSVCGGDQGDEQAGLAHTGSLGRRGRSNGDAGGLCGEIQAAGSCGGGSEELADKHSVGLEGWAGKLQESEGRRDVSHATSGSKGCSAMGNAELAGSQGQRNNSSAFNREDAGIQFGTTNGDNANSGQTQPALGGDAHGSACGMDYAELYTTCDNRTDELRLLGNGVVPATAERAFVTLMQELTK